MENAMKHQKMLIEEIIRIAELKSARGLANKLGCHPSIITRIGQGKRPFTPFQAKAIEEMTNGKVDRMAIRPDIFL
jgi:DNA-binding transcriptional regulator YdaS (Cro superfamily)